MILRAETHIKEKKTGYYDELIGAVLAQYRRPESTILMTEIPYQGRRCYYEPTSAVRHNNTDLNK